jgi:hypothetical protein
MAERRVKLALALRVKEMVCGPRSSMNHRDGKARTRLTASDTEYARHVVVGAERGPSGYGD